MTTNSILKSLRKGLCLFVSAALVATGTLPLTATAQTFSCDPYATDRGGDTRCQSVRIHGTPLAAPKLQWTRLTDMPVTPLTGDQNRVYGGSEAVNLGNRSALVLGLQPSEVANMVAAFPSNVPYVFARYSHLDNTLRIDVFKIEKEGVGNSMRAGLYHANFGPSHGDAWRLSRSYISPSEFSAGNAGVNPFSSFAEPGTDNFRGISLEGSMVAVGHAMRMVGAPLGLFSSANTRFTTTTSTSSGVFTKKTTTRVFGHAKPRWFIVQPHQMLARSTTISQASFCAADPASTSCPLYAAASAGVGFEEFDGGTLSDIENQWQVHQETKSGLSFLGALILIVVGSYALVGLMSTAGIGAFAAPVGAGSSVAMGGMSTFMVGAGAITPFGGTLAALGFEVALTTASMVLSGANLGSTINANPAVMLGVVSVQKGTASMPNLGEMERKLAVQLNPLMKTDMSQGPNSLQGFDTTVMGACSPGTLNCSINSGMVQRVQQYSETNDVQFLRDNDGLVLRSNTPTGPSGGIN